MNNRIIKYRAFNEVLINIITFICLKYNHLLFFENRNIYLILALKLKYFSIL